ncbi:hypothetical protein, partial [Marinitenerispora sediminis]|uniref:hypothetical protein n=1 Tax=Marinitenerispora sediminis TaxID=1931232 RepID=UPI000DFBB69B
MTEIDVSGVFLFLALVVGAGILVPMILMSVRAESGSGRRVGEAEGPGGDEYDGIGTYRKVGRLRHYWLGGGGGGPDSGYGGYGVGGGGGYGGGDG